MPVLIIVFLFVYSCIGLIAGITMFFQGVWPAPTGWLKTTVAAIAFGPFFWIFAGLFILFMGIHEWLEKE